MNVAQEDVMTTALVPSQIYAVPSCVNAPISKDTCNTHK